MQTNDSHNKAVWLAGAGIAGLVLGGLIGYMTGTNSPKMEQSKTETSQMASTEDGVTVGGAKMVRTKDIVDNAAGASNVSTVVAAVKAAELVETLKSEGPFTVFAPNNAAFEALPAGTVDTLLKPENKAMLAGILTYHVVSGTYTSADLMVMASKGEMLTTVQGEKLAVVMEDNMLKIKDAKGNTVEIETADVISSNGVTHVIKNVLMHS